jgi:hypothetical protein
MSKLPYISPELIQSYQTEIAKSATPATVKRKSSSLKKFFNWASENGHIQENPFGNQPSPGDNLQTLSVQPPKPKFKLLTFGNFLKLGILGTLIILIFLLAQKLKIPIPFIKTPASTQEFTGISSPIVPTPTPAPKQQALILSPWKLYTKLILTDSSGNPAVGNQTVTFKIYKSQDDPSSLWNSQPQTITTDTNGNSLISLDNVPTDIFFQNEKLYLEANLGDFPSGSRIPISTANVAANLGGFFPASPTEGAGPSTIPVLSDDGFLLLASESPAIKAKNGNLLVEGQAVLISSPSGSDGNITINPDGYGLAQFLFEGSGRNFLNVQAPNLKSGSLFYGLVSNNSAGYDLIRLQSGSSKTTRFSVDALGNTNLTGTLSTSGVQRLTSLGSLTNITGYSQNSGNFSITQSAGDTATITKSSTALSDVLTLALDERSKANSDYSTLTLKRYSGSSNAYALLVDEGNVRLDEQFQLGRYSSNPSAIGSGSLVYNTSTNSVYVWNGSSWQEVGSSTITFANITSGINITAAMEVGSGASLNYSGTGTINATTLNSIADTSFLRSDTSDNFTSGTLTTDAGTTLDINGDLIVSDSDVAFDAASTVFSITGDLTVSPSGGQLILAGSLNAGGLTNVVYNAFADATDAPDEANITAGNDLYIGGDLEVDGLIYGTISGSAGSVAWSGIVDPTDNLTLNHAARITTMNWTAAGALDAWTFNFTNNSSTTTTQNAVVINNAANGSSSTDTNTETLLLLQQLDNSTGDSKLVDNALKIDAAADAGITNGITITNSGGNITNGINIADTGGGTLTTGLNFSGSFTNEISLRNGETISNTTDGIINLMAIVQIGAGGAGSSTPYLFGLDVKSDTGDPAGGFEGAMYYNTYDNKFRCYQNAGWTDCVGGGGGGGYWTLNTSDGTLYPVNETVDVLIGATATSSAEFAFTNLAGGTPTFYTTGVIQAGGAASAAYNRIGTATTDHGLASSNDLLISGKLEVDGTLFLDSSTTIANSAGTATILFSATPTTTANTLSASNWLVENTGNAGQAALMVNQLKGGDIFTASASSVTKFTISNAGNVSINGSGVMLTVGGGSGKVDMGTVDPVYNINGEKYATYMSAMTGVKEETTGNVTTYEYLPGIGYRNLIDFKTQTTGSDLWLFGKATDVRNNIDKMVVLLSPADNTKTWYEIDKNNYTLAIYSSKPTTISYRLTAPRFDYTEWSNYNTNPDSIGFIINDPDLSGGSSANPNPLTFLDFEIVKDGVYKVYQNISEGGKIVVDEFGSFANLVAGNIRAGAVETSEFTTENLYAFQGTIDNLLIKTGLVSPNVQTALISPLPNEKDITIQVGNTKQTDGLGKLKVQNPQGETVTSIDETGNVYTQGNLTALSATFSGTLVANKIQSTNLDEIQNLLHQVEEDQNLLKQAQSWNVNTTTPAGQLDNLMARQLFITEQAAINSLSITKTVAIGTDLIFGSGSQMENGNWQMENTLNSLSAPLQIQNLALAPVEIMAGKLRIETNGDVKIEGNLFVAGKIEAKELALNDGVNGITATINASGSAQFKDVQAEGLTIASSDNSSAEQSISPSEITTNATVGKAVIPAGTAEITINNSSISDTTLIYITATSSTLNNVLYVKSKEAGKFVVGFTDAINVDVSFNWWLVQTK